MGIPDDSLDVTLNAIGWVRHDAADIPRHWTVSDLEGDLDIRPDLAAGLADIAAGQKIMVIFLFDRSPPFSEDELTQETRQSKAIKGVFSICSPRRPNPIGLSVVEVLSKEGCRLRVRGLDMFDGTPILDIKPTFKPDD